MGYYIKGDFPPQKKERDLNLSNSHHPRNTSGQYEAARAPSLNQSRGNILPANAQTSSQNPNFRIGVLGSSPNNMSRELSISRKKEAVNSSALVNVSTDERSRNQVGHTSAIFNRRQSRVLLSRNGSPKAGLDVQTAIQQRIDGGYANVLGSITGQTHVVPVVKERHQQLNASMGENPVLSPSQRADNLNRSQNVRKTVPAVQEMDPAKEDVTQGNVTNQASSSHEDAVVRWADALDGQDIRIELKFGDCLGQGSFAKVYEGFDKRLKMPVAIKVIDKRKIKDTETKKKALIEEEIYIFVRMSHPNIVKFIRLLEDVKRVGYVDRDFYRDGVVRPKHSQHILQRHFDQEAARRSLS